MVEALSIQNFVCGGDGTFRVDLPDETYTVTPTMGDAEWSHDNAMIDANG